MKPEITLRRIFHRDEWRYAVVFENDRSLTNIIRLVNGSKWSQTQQCWHVPCNEETLKRVLGLFHDKATVNISELTRSQGKENAVAVPVEEKKPDDKQLSDINSGSDNEDEVDFIPPLRIISDVVGRRKFGPVEFRINEKEDKLAIRFLGYYDQKWIEEIKTFGRVKFDRKSMEFLLPWSLLTVDSLSDYFSSIGVRVNVVKTVPSKATREARQETGDRIRSRVLGNKAIEGLELMARYLDEVRYSERTNGSYLASLELFFKYFSDKDPLRITPEEISAFVYDFIVINGYSSSYQNQMISAIKIYYRIAGGGTKNIQVLERPRKGRALPKVFSKQEVQKILNSARSTKHKLLLWMIYSCGLRRSEVTNILLTDLDRDRGVLNIREGKGRVDRVVPVSKKIWEKLDDYLEGFKPVKYLFEGQSGGRYSVESVYHVFKQALERAGIKKEVGVHSLRHSYATHLHESGLDIRYIQELLGHKSTRTTEIYTHVSRRNLVIVRSPIEDLDLK
jgi:integrase/recombinase XerD